MYVQEFKDRHGRVRRYFRRPGFKRVALPGASGSPEFLEAYNAALAGHQIRQIGAERCIPGTLSAAIAAYYQHASFLALSPETRKMRRAILERLRSRHGDKRFELMERPHIARLLADLKPFAARNWLKTLRGLMRFAVETGLRRDDPTRDIRPTKVRAGTRHSWTEEEIAQFEARHPIGTRPRLAMALLLYTAARRGDVVQLGPQHIRNGILTYRQSKTQHVVAMPVHPALAEILAAAPTSGHLTFLITAAGAPFSAAGFGNLFRDWCNEAELPHCSAHGLRKAQARRLAEAGCSAHQIAAITGHKTLAEVQLYAAAADQSALARAAMARVSGPNTTRTRSVKPKARRVSTLP
jgi:integrase